MDKAYVNDESNAAREPIRCELVPVPPHVVATTLSGRYKEKPAPPPLILDVGTNNAIRLIDPNTKALIASDWLAQVTATPAKFRFADENNPSYTQSLLIVDVPGL